MSDKKKTNISEVNVTDIDAGNRENVSSIDAAEEVKSDAASEQVKAAAPRFRTMSPGKLVMRRFFRSKLSMVGLIILIFLFAFSYFGPLFSPYGEIENTEERREVQTVYKYQIEDSETGEIYTVFEVRTATVTGMTYPTWKNWLGTDQYGYDVLTRLMYGGRISLTLSFLVVFAELILGVLLGGIAGYFGKWVDQVIMRLVDILNCIPGLPLMLICSSLLNALKVPSSQRIYWLMFILTVFSWGGTARLVRGQILSLREQEFMLAAESTGLSASRKIFKHLIPNVMPQLIVSATLGLGGIILYESTLSYLGLGVPFPYAAWGSMINAASPSSGSGRTILQYYPNLWIPAGLLIVLAVVAFNFVGDGLRDAFDPKMKR